MKLLIAVAGLSLALIANCASAQTHATPQKIPPWIWPLDNYQASSISQDYTEYDACLKTENGACTERSNKYHTGLDIGADLDTPIKAASDGYVVLFMPNGDSNCQQPNCTDHGDGNTIIVQDANNPDLFYHYQHMDQKLSDVEDKIENQGACGTPITTDPNDPNLAVYYWNCTQQQLPEITQGTVIGYVGGSGFGQLDSYPNHLHFEAKTFPTFYSYVCYNNSECCPQHRCFGYSKEHPSKVGYRDPVNFVEGVEEYGAPFQVQLSNGISGLSLRLGPNTNYAEQTTWDTGEGPYWTRRQEHAPTGNCSFGWYKVRKTKYVKAYEEDSEVFDETNRPGAGKLPDVWVCKGDGDTHYVERVH